MTDKLEDDARTAILNAIDRKASEPSLRATEIRELAEAFNAVKDKTFATDGPNAPAAWIEALRRTANK